MDQPGANKPTFLWRGILILLPVVLLATAGIYSIRRERQLALVEAQSRGQSDANALAREIAANLGPALEKLGDGTRYDSRMQIDFHGRPITLGDSKIRAAFSDLPKMDTKTGVLLPTEGMAWNKARQLEFSRADDSQLSKAWRDFITMAPSEPYLTQARYNLALALAGLHKNSEAANLLDHVKTNYTSKTESGCPYWLLAEVQEAAVTPPRSFTGVYRDVVYHPTFETPALLGRILEMDPNVATTGREWMDRWNADEQARDFYQHVQPRLSHAPMAFWTNWDGRSWLVVAGQMPALNGEWLVHYEASAVNHVLSNVLQTVPVPPYAQLGFTLEGKDVLPVNMMQSPALGYQRGGTAAGVPLNFSVVEVMAHPEILFDEQRRRTRWFMAFILATAVVAFVGFVSAYRGFHQQLRLNEMKSNFVSSVSHELRAPIASMRLMAESLERGKIADAVKQKEYYGFLVQESRRLSSLIENILDFSRIEQGRKTYQAEPADIPALAAKTVEIMRPCAVDRGVQLTVTASNGAETAPVQYDGLAIQQALINLIDNAIKHSPNGGSVRVGWEQGGGEWRICVEDDGPGIPAEEHKRIFERFYRRGSELRRETQGIGIGLSIVKHTIEAHGGRVELQSEAGKGSRFTIVLPVQLTP